MWDVEVSGMRGALEAVDGRAKVLLLADSKAAVSAVKRAVKTGKARTADLVHMAALVAERQRRLRDAGAVKLAWFKAHVGIEGNEPERADVKAREGASSDATKLEWERAIAKVEDERWTSHYTDGSRMNDLTGAGTFKQHPRKRTSIYLGRLSTVNDAGLLAMSGALESQANELLIITDSQVAITKLQRIANGEPNYEGASQRVREAWERRAETGDLDVAVMWVKAHKGIMGNTEADTAAKIGTCLQYQEETITEAGWRQQAKAYRALERNRLDITYRPLQRLGRRVATLAGILGGKGLREWKFKIGTVDSPECHWCGEDTESTRHILTQCRVWKQKCPRRIEDLCRPKSDDRDRSDEERDRLLELLDWAGGEMTLAEVMDWVAE
ncbi:hypothetical protein BDZ91DRAFT_797845 [Kalaharituber pfeilii]|nr:hypothetical protein BDZ91DRAFT_797845 [Kalaharituber pfeilii]